MAQKLLSKSNILIILLAVSIGLISLGMRLPSLSGLSSTPGKPKPRPRAIVQNQIKQCKQQIVQAPTPLLAIVAEVSVLIRTPESTVAQPAAPCTPSFRSVFIPKASRAPPICV